MRCERYERRNPNPELRASPRVGVRGIRHAGDSLCELLDEIASRPSAVLAHVRMRGAGHNFLVARPRETLTALTDFVDAVDRARG